jgi:hypothetical protein
MSNALVMTSKTRTGIDFTDRRQDEAPIPIGVSGLMQCTTDQI